jgi:hyperosmotically inducible protein
MKIRYLITLCAVMVVGAALAVALAVVAGKAEEKTQIEDSIMTAKTKIALFADARVRGRQISVEAHKGLMMLRGKVDSEEAKNATEAIAKNIQGVKSVKNQLEVVAPSKRKTVDTKDDAITARVKRHIAKESLRQNADIDVTTNVGVVSLTGEVPDILASAQASWTAWQVAGVKSVKNDLTLKEKK